MVKKRVKQQKAPKAGVHVEFGKRLRAVRESIDQTQDDIAKIVGRTRPTVSQWEAGVTLPTRENMLKLIEHIKVPEEWLLYGTGTAPLLPKSISRQRRRAPDHPARDRGIMEAGKIVVVSNEQAALNLRLESWLVPTYALPAHPTHMTIFPCRTALGSAIKAGDYVFVDRSQQNIEARGIWLIAIENIGLLLVQSRITKLGDKPVLKLLSDGIEFDLGAARAIIGRAVARFTSVD